MNVTFNGVEVDSGDQLSSYKTSSKKPLLLFPDGNVIRSLVIDTCLAVCFSCCEEVIALTICTHAKNLYTPCYLCTEEGSRRFAAVEPPGTSV